MAKQNPTAAELRAVFSYDAQTGVITRISTGRQCGSKHSAGYLEVYALGGRFLAHRVAWALMHGDWPSGQIDHINGHRTDNRLANLRVVCPRENAENRHGASAKNKLGRLGVYWSGKSKRFYASIKVGARRIHLGSFLDADSAQAAYNEAKLKHHGLVLN